MRVGHRHSFELDRLLRQADDQEAWTSALRAVLPDDLAPHCWVTEVRRDTLIVVTDHPAWATKARFSLPSVLPSLRNLAAFTNVRQSIVRVAADTREGESPVASAAQPDKPVERDQGSLKQTRQKALNTIRNLLDSESS